MDETNNGSIAQLKSPDKVKQWEFRSGNNYYCSNKCFIIPAMCTEIEKNNSNIVKKKKKNKYVLFCVL